MREWIRLSKPLLEQLHLYNGSVDDRHYDDLYERLAKLSLRDLKLFYAVYWDALERIELFCLENWGHRLDVFNERETEVSYLASEDRVTEFLAGRISENVYNYLTDDWDKRLDVLNGELIGLDEHALYYVAYKTHTVIHVIETYLVRKDEYWYPNSMVTMDLLISMGYSLYKEKERVWQPKTGADMDV